MSTVLNARGVPLSYSAAAETHLSANGGTPELQGTGANEIFWGDADVTVTMYGKGGDDFYNLYAGSNRAIENADAGVDTVKTWMNYRLPDHIENLVVTGDGRYAFGNDADNIITGGDGRQTLDGRAGDDVLEGGAGADVFVIEKGMGSDLILDLQGHDVVRLAGHNFKSFGDVLNKATQVGDDLRIGLGDGEFLVLADTRAADLDASQFQVGLDRSGLKLTFADNFNGLDLWDGESGTWDSNYWWGAENGTTLNEELQWYIDHDYAPTASANPFSVNNGVMSITAERAASNIKPEINGYDYTSGMLTTYESFAQTYGYYEIRADVPDQQGLWPTFWLLPADGGWPPELDVLEMRGQNPTELVMTAHSEATGSHTRDINIAKVADTSGFHTYGALWDAEEVVWYFDGVEVARTETPDDMHDPMYMIVNLAVGGFAGAPAEGQDTLGSLKVDYIRAYSFEGATYDPDRDLSGNDRIVGSVEDDALGGGAGKDMLLGRAGDDRLMGQSGNDTLRGEAGSDTLDGGGGNDTADYKTETKDWLIDLDAGEASGGGDLDTLISMENALGGKGNDTVIGDDGDNRLTGNGGRDRIEGGLGDDRMTGGGMADTFVFGRLDQAGGDGDDRISDFNKWGDKLSFRDLVDRDDDSDVDLDDLLASVSSIADKGAGKSVVVTFDNGASVVFAKAGTGAVDSLTDLVKDAETQILISSTS